MVRRLVTGTVLLASLVAWPEVAAAATIKTVPLPPGGREGTLRGITCLKRTDCWAAGWYTKTTNSLDNLHQIGLAVHYTGARMRPMSLPRPAGASGWQLQDISCRSDRNCWSVGSFATASQVQLWVVHWNGHRWRSVPTTAPSGSTGALLTDVSCYSRRSCVAAGSWGNSSGESALAERLTLGVRPSTHMLRPISPGAGISASFFGVKCLPNPTFCQFTGVAAGGGGQSASLVERWSGGHWTLQHPSDPYASGHTELDGVDCVSASSCLGVGAWNSAVIWHQPVAERWNGRSWTLTNPRIPAGQRDAYLLSAACISSHRCFAFGSSSNSSGTGFTLAERWNGSAWSVVPTASPSSVPVSELVDGACPGTHLCIAVGDSDTNSTGGSRAFLETLGVR